MKRTYTVEGRWPFPSDMLRHDDAQAATIADRNLIDRLSGDSTDDGFGLKSSVLIKLVMEAGEPSRARPQGRLLPNRRRWESFGWRVVTAGADYDEDQRYAASIRDVEALRRSALAKLTAQEKDALGLRL